MKIVVAAFAYNERKYISHMVDYYQSQGCELLILDNYSNDGTYEWLVENKIRTLRVDTNESFHLAKLQHTLLHELTKVCPDWVVYTGIDTYFYFEGTIRAEIERAAYFNYNTIQTTHLEAYNTGENFALPFQDNYFYIDIKKRKREMIAKYDAKGFRLIADTIRIHNKKIYASDGMLINYGQCKPKAERKETYARRRKAWKLGEPEGHGQHYVINQAHNWIWTKEELLDIRETPYYRMIK